MSVSTVYAALNSALTGGTIDLWTASANPALPGLRKLLGLFGITSSYMVNNAVLTQGVDNVTLAGSGVFGQPGDPRGMSFAANDTLVYRQPGNEDGVFIFSIGMRDRGWIFSSFFNADALPESQRADPVDLAIGWETSFLVGLRIDAAVFSATSLLDATLTLSGLLPDSALFGPLRDFMAPWPLQLSGPLTMPSSWTDPPVMTLTARAAGNAGFSIGQESGAGGPSGLALKDLGFELLIRTDLNADDWGRTAFSVLNLIGTVTLGAAPDALIANLTIQVLTALDTWHLNAQFDPKHASVVRGIAQLTTIFGMPAIPLPDNFPLLQTFKFRDVDLYFSAPGKKDLLPTLRFLTVTIASPGEWTPPVPFVTVHGVGTIWTWGWTTVDDKSGQTRTTSNITGSVFGSFRFGSGGGGQDASAPGDGGGGGTAIVAADTSKIDIDVAVSLPDLFIKGQMRKGDVINIGQAFSYFFGAPGPEVKSDGKQAYISRLGFFADPISQSYSAETAIVFSPDGEDPSIGWSINLVVITVQLHELEFWIKVQAGRVGGGISGVLSLEQGEQETRSPRLMLSASYPVQNPNSPQGWTFEGHLYEGTSIDLTELVTKFLGLENPPASVPHLMVDRLDIKFTTGTKAYELGGTISVRWTPELFGSTLRISVSASADIFRPPNESADKPTQGRLNALFAINRISIEAAMDVGVDEPTYLFKVMFDNIWLQAVTSWRGKNDPARHQTRHQALSLQLGGTTLGDVLEYLVNLAAPTIGFQLDSPWDILKRIDLSRFVLTLDPTDNVVEFIYKADVDLGFGRLSSIGVRYTKGGSGKVDLILEGSFLGKSYEGEDALAWDVVNDPPPAMPGTGTALVDLRYLGIGQRIVLRDPPASVAGTLDLLKEFMKPVDKPDKLPGREGIIAFSADSQWLIGLDIGLMGGTIDLAVIFNDPVLYGLSIALSGEKAGSLAGLRFEILYKKITNDIGMWRVELRIPDAFRTFQLGVASITLGTVVVEIYTNGNFKVDLGFPYNQDFSRSFSLQAYIFIGRGGFYLGVLNGATSSRVPRITNGNFAPVLELGIGIAAGVGREIRAGIMAGGAYVELQVIFEGVLGWFEPTSAGTAPAKYFRAQGIAALHGKVYGYVDFKIIKVSVTLEAYAQVSALFECYRPTVFRLDVSVRAEAEVKILFVTISFGFSVKLELEFTLGNVEQTPWILAADQGGSTARATSLRLPSRGTGGALRLRRNRALRLHSLHRHYMRTVRLAMAGEPAETWCWKPAKKLFPDGKHRTALLHLLPVVSLADVPVSWTSAKPAVTPPHFRAAFLLCADSGVPPHAVTAAQTRLRSAALHPFAANADDKDVLTADLWVKVFLLYALYSIPHGPTDENSAVTSAQLALLATVLDAPATPNAGFAIAMLDQVFDNNLHLLIGGDPAKTDIDAEAAATVGGMAAPLPPGLWWDATPGGKTYFNQINPVGPWYEWGVAKILGHYVPVGGASGKRPETDNPAGYESFPTYMFRDYCLMIAKAAVQEARQLMTTASATVAAEENGTVQTLAQVACGFSSAAIDYAVRAGDTVTSVAQAIGATPAEILFLNNPGFEARLAAAPVGSTLPVALGIAPEVLAEDNVDIAFALTSVSLGTVPHQVADGETLNGIAALFNQSNVASLFTNTDLGATAELLRAGANFAATPQRWTGGPSTVLRAAAIAFARYTLPALTQTAWYAQAVFDLNAELLKTLFPDQQIPTVIELPPGQVLNVPSAFNVVSSTVPYTTVAGDTLERIGIALSLEQVYPTVSPPEAPQWQTFKTQVASPSAGTYDLPAWNGLFVLPGETMEASARRLVASASWTGTNPQQPTDGSWSYDWVAIVQWAGPAVFLSPLAVVPVPGALAEAAEGGTLSFGTLAKTFGMSIPDAAERLADTAGLYAVGTQLKVTQLPVMTVGQLVTGVLGSEALPRVVNQASRNLMAGLRLPALADEDGHTVPSKTTTKPLYDLTGQQIDLNIDINDPTKVALALTVTSQTSWITFADSDVLRADEGHAGLAARHPNSVGRNPGLATRENLPAGMVVLTAEATTLAYSYTNAQIIAMGPATSYSIPVAKGPAPLPLSGSVPRPYGLDHRVELQTPVALPIPNATSTPLSGQPSLWPFPSDLLVRAAAGVGNAYEILATRQEEIAARHASAVANSTWGCVVSVTLKQVASSLSLFTLQTVNEADRAILLALRNWLLGKPPAGTIARVLVQPSPDAGNPDGLSVLSGTLADTYIIKTNLSTDSQPQSPAALARVSRDTPAGSPFASLAELENFVTLLWEGSVVGGIGYYVGLDKPLPASSIIGNGQATIQLLVIASTQQAAAPTGRKLLPFNNCALIGPGLDAAIATVFVEDYGDGDMVHQALVPPGSNGFTLALDAPPATKDPDPIVRLRQLFSLLGVSIAKGSSSPFDLPASCMPAPPAPSPKDALQAWQRERLLRRRLMADPDDALDAQPWWKFDQVLPLYRFGPASLLPKTVGLPVAEEDPYRGFGIATALPDANFAFGFGDVLGNRTAPPPAGQGTVAAPTGYTDPLIGVTDWPAIVGHYALKPNGSAASLSIVLEPRSAAMMPSPSQLGAAAADAASRQAEAYAKSYYQLGQIDPTTGQTVKGRVVTSLQVGDAPALSFDVTILWRYAAAAYAFAAAAAMLRDQPAAGGSKLADMMAIYHVRATEIALAHEQVRVQSLFGAGPLTVPAYAVFLEHDSAATIAARPRPNGWPTPTALAILSDPDNGVLPLRPGAVLRVDPPLNVSTGDGKASLHDLAKANGTDAALLATDNAAATLLAPGFEFEVAVAEDTFVVVTVTALDAPVTIDSFDKVCTEFANNGVNVTAADLAELAADKPGMFQAGKSLVSKVWLAAADETLTHNGSGLDQAALAALNQATPDLFDIGALVTLGAFGGGNGVLPEADQTLRQFADAYACPPELVIAANVNVTLPNGTRFAVPGLFAWPEDMSPCRVPYSVLTGDSLDNIASRFAWPAGDAALLLAEANADMPGVLKGKVTLTVTVDTEPVVITTPDGGESLNAAVAQVKVTAPAATLNDLVTSIRDRTGVLATGALLMCASARLAANTSPAEIAAVYGIAAAALAQANAGTPGAIVAGLTIYAQDGVTSVATQANDTFNTLVVRFAALGVQVDPGQIAAATRNQTAALFKAATLMLLPPVPAQITVPLAQNGPYADALFPLTVALRLTRPQGLINPFFAPGTFSATEQVESLIPAPLKSPGADSQGSLTFEAFIRDTRLALPNLRVATGLAPDTRQDLWGVNFGANGISSVHVFGGTTVPGESNPQPRFFALEPLYRTLVTRSAVAIKPLREDGTLGAVVPTDFQGIDVEPWAARFLADVDRLLNPANSARIYGDAATRQSLQNLLASKALLTTAIPAGLGVVLAIQDSKAEQGLAIAAEALTQQLGVSLARAYATSTVVQFDRTATSPWQPTEPGRKPAELFGQLGLDEEGALRRSWTTTAGKCWLDDSNPFVTLLMTESDPASHRNVTAEMTFDISELEHNIAGVGLPEGYVASNWLGFVPPLAGDNRPAALQTDLGKVSIPIPLRDFPALPIVLGQTASPTAVLPPTAVTRARRRRTMRLESSIALADMPLWDHSFTYSHQHAEQDDVMLTLQYNLRKPLQAQADEDPPDLFTELAQYLAGADPLWVILDQLADGSGPLSPTERNAVATFETLVARVASYWGTRHTGNAMRGLGDSAEALPQASFRLRARVNDRDAAGGGREVGSLSLTRLDAQPGPNGNWPVLHARTVSGEQVLLVSSEISATEMLYSVPANAAVPSSWPVFTLAWTRLNVEAWQNATGMVNVERNHKLLGENGPDTNPAFIFQTETVKAASIVTPLNQWSECVRLEGAPGPDFIASALNNAFYTLFPQAMASGTGLRIAMAVSYAYEMSVDPLDAAHGLISTTPAYLYPDSTLDLQTASLLQAAVKQWQGQRQPVIPGGEWLFALTLYSSLESEQRPLLLIDNLFCPLAPLAG